MSHSKISVHVLVVVTVLACSVAAAADPGRIVWWDLVSEDAAAAEAFYTGLFGWQFRTAPTGARRAALSGREIAAIHQISDEMRDEVESTWVAGVLVTSVEDTLARAEAAGGQTLRQSTTIPGAGRYAVIRDPQGAVLMLVDPIEELGGRPTGPGAFLWSELWTHDTAAAAGFYRAVLGYQTATITRPGGAYTVFGDAAAPYAGLLELPEPDMRPAWAPYLGVIDLAATLDRARALGGKVLVEPRADFAEGRIALLADPTGGAFFVYQLTREAR